MTFLEPVNIQNINKGFWTCLQFEVKCGRPGTCAQSLDLPYRELLRAPNVTIKLTDRYVLCNQK